MVHTLRKSQKKLVWRQEQRKKHSYEGLLEPTYHIEYKQKMWSPTVYLPVLGVYYANINGGKYPPFPGVYFFTFSMMKHEDVEEVYVYLMHNGNTVFSMYRWVLFSIAGLLGPRPMPGTVQEPTAPDSPSLRALVYQHTARLELLFRKKEIWWTWE